MPIESVGLHLTASPLSACRYSLAAPDQGEALQPAYSVALGSVEPSACHGQTPPRHFLGCRTSGPCAGGRPAWLAFEVASPHPVLPGIV